MVNIQPGAINNAETLDLSTLISEKFFTDLDTRNSQFKFPAQIYTWLIIGINSSQQNKVECPRPTSTDLQLFITQTK